MRHEVELDGYGLAISILLGILVGTLLLCSCAPAPGSTLLQGVSQAVPIEAVEVIITIDLLETQLYCTEYASWYLVLLSCITNGCFIPACAIPFVDATGIIKKCYVYSWIDVEFLIEHELRHCRGYKDLFY